MPAAAFAPLAFYGPGVAAAITTAAPALVGGASATARAEGAVTGLGSSPFAKPTRLVNSPGLSQGVGSSPQALPKARARLGGVVRLNVLSQDDVTGAVLEAEVEPGLTLRQALRLISAVLGGEISGAGGGTITIRNAVADSKDRVIATVDGSGNRTAITYDLG